MRSPCSTFAERFRQNPVLLPHVHIQIHAHRTVVHALTAKLRDIATHQS